MSKFLKYILIIFVITSFESFAKENFFNEAKNLFDKGKFEESKFLFQRNIVFNPKDAKSYLYLARIYETEENEIEKEKNVNTTLLLEPDNEDAMYMLIDLKLKRSDYAKVKELSEKFEIICSSLCNKIDSIKERLTKEQDGITIEAESANYNNKKKLLDTEKSIEEVTDVKTNVQITIEDILENIKEKGFENTAIELIMFSSVDLEK